MMFEADQRSDATVRFAVGVECAMIEVGDLSLGRETLPRQCRRHCGNAGSRVLGVDGFQLFGLDDFVLRESNIHLPRLSVPIYHLSADSIRLPRLSG